MDYDYTKTIRTIAQTVGANIHKPPNTACLAVENLESSALPQPNCHQDLSESSSGLLISYCNVGIPARISTRTGKEVHKNMGVL